MNILLFFCEVASFLMLLGKCRIQAAILNSTSLQLGFNLGGSASAPSAKEPESILESPPSGKSNDAFQKSLLEKYGFKAHDLKDFRLRDITLNGTDGGKVKQISASQSSLWITDFHDNVLRISRDITKQHGWKKVAEKISYITASNFINSDRKDEIVAGISKNAGDACVFFRQIPGKDKEMKYLIANNGPFTKVSIGALGYIGLTPEKTAMVSNLQPDQIQSAWNELPHEMKNVIDVSMGPNYIVVLTKNHSDQSEAFITGMPLLEKPIFARINLGDHDFRLLEAAKLDHSLVGVDYKDKAWLSRDHGANWDLVDVDSEIGSVSILHMNAMYLIGKARIMEYKYQGPVVESMFPLVLNLGFKINKDTTSESLPNFPTSLVNSKLYRVKLADSLPSGPYSLQIFAVDKYFFPNLRISRIIGDGNAEFEQLQNLPSNPTVYEFESGAVYVVEIGFVAKEPIFTKVKDGDFIAIFNDLSKDLSFILKDNPIVAVDQQIDPFRSYTVTYSTVSSFYSTRYADGITENLGVHNPLSTPYFSKKNSTISIFYISRFGEPYILAVSWKKDKFSIKLWNNESGAKKITVETRLVGELIKDLKT